MNYADVNGALPPTAICGSLNTSNSCYLMAPDFSMKGRILAFMEQTALDNALNFSQLTMTPANTTCRCADDLGLPLPLGREQSRFVIHTDGRGLLGKPGGDELPEQHRDHRRRGIDLLRRRPRLLRRSHRAEQHHRHLCGDQRRHLEHRHLERVHPVCERDNADESQHLPGYEGLRQGRHGADDDRQQLHRPRRPSPPRPPACRAPMTASRGSSGSSSTAAPAAATATSRPRTRGHATSPAAAPPGTRPPPSSAPARTTPAA